MKLGLGILGNVHLSVGVRIKAYVGVEIKLSLGILGKAYLSVRVRIKAHVGVEIRPRDFRKSTFKC